LLSPWRRIFCAMTILRVISLAAKTSQQISAKMPKQRAGIG
jgi:hypothetical protein